MTPAGKTGPEAKNKAVYFSMTHRLFQGRKKEDDPSSLWFYFSGFSTGVAEP